MDRNSGIAQVGAADQPLAEANASGQGLALAQRADEHLPRPGDQLPAEEPEAGLLVKWASSLAAASTCLAVLVTGWLVRGHSAERLLLYALLLLLYLGLKLAIDLRSRLSRWLWRHLWVYLVLAGLLALALQSQADESFLQPLVFTLPVIYASMAYRAQRVTLIGLSYLALMNLGIWLSGLHHVMGYLFPTIGYASLMSFIYAFTRLSVEQSAARRQADALAGSLALQRDYMVRLVEVTATLTRDLELETVLAQVAAEGATLARAGLARVWLRQEQEAEQPLYLAAAVPSGAPGVAELSEPDWERLLGDQPRIDDHALLLPLLYKGAHIGALELRQPRSGRFAPEDLELLRPFANVAVVAIENARLYQQLHLSAALAERNRLARELHDTIAQGLTAVTMQLEAAQRSFERDPERTRARLTRAGELARETLGEVRRSVWTLAAPLVAGQSLSQALEELGQRFAVRSGLALDYTPDADAPELAYDVATQVLRIVQEALQNVEKHAQASRVTIGTCSTPGELAIWVRDDGVGFDPAALPERGTQGDSGFGLLSLRERARLGGGSLRLESAPGQGTCITVTIPQEGAD